MAHIDGYLIPVPQANKDAYLALAKTMAPMFKKYGATRVVEAWSSVIPEGEHTSFPKSVKLEADEAVVFSWVEWPSKQSRDEGMEKMMKDPFFASDQPAMPFDGKRMILGQFDILLDQ